MYSFEIRFNNKFAVGLKHFFFTFVITICFFFSGQCQFSGEYRCSNRPNYQFIMHENDTFLLVYYLFSLLSVGNNVITSCEGSGKYGSNIYIDFHAISRPCICTALPSFAGELLIITREIINVCNTEIYVKYANTKLRYGCLIPYSSQTLIVNINHSVEVRAAYLSPYTSGTFYHCLGFQQNGKHVFKS